MTRTILLTGFGPFPGAPFNPTGALVEALADRRTPGLRHIRRVAHVFATNYQAVDRELPGLIRRERPDALIMFGLAARRPLISIETQARNTLTRAVPDASGQLPGASAIVPGGRAALALQVPAPRLVAAVRAAGIPAVLSDDAGSYLCNYLCWRAGEAVERDGIPRLVAFVHVPNAHIAKARRYGPPRSRLRITFDDLVRAGEAIMGAAIRR
jgi:pyroglutamyl-peptidase